MMGERRIVPQAPNKRRSPALYELIAGQSRDDVPGAAAGTPTPRTPPTSTGVAGVEAKPSAARVQQPVRVEPAVRHAPFEDEDRVLGISPGRVLRVPIGYVFMGVFVVLVALFTTYTIGYKQRDNLAQRDKELAAQNETRQIVDPMIQRSLPPAAVTHPPTATPPVAAPPTHANTKSITDPTENPAAGSSSSAARLTVVEKPADDPRQVGLNYAVVATLPLREATAAGQYLASKGFGVALVPLSDKKLWQVTPTRGFEGDKYQAAEGKAFEKSIKDLGKAFKRDMKGASDFSDLFWRKLKDKG